MLSQLKPIFSKLKIEVLYKSNIDWCFNLCTFYSIMTDVPKWPGTRSHTSVSTVLSVRLVSRLWWSQDDMRPHPVISAPQCPHCPQCYQPVSGHIWLLRVVTCNMVLTTLQQAQEGNFYHCLINMEIWENWEINPSILHGSPELNRATNLVKAIFWM